MAGEVGRGKIRTWTTEPRPQHYECTLDHRTNTTVLPGSQDQNYRRTRAKPGGQGSGARSRVGWAVERRSRLWGQEQGRVGRGPGEAVSAVECGQWGQEQGTVGPGGGGHGCGTVSGRRQ